MRDNEALTASVEGLSDLKGAQMRLRPQTAKVARVPAERPKRPVSAVKESAFSTISDIKSYLHRS